MQQQKRKIPKMDSITTKQYGIEKQIISISEFYFVYTCKKGRPMKNNQIGVMLKKYRKMNALSVNDVVVELHDKYGVNVAEKTVYGWESNQAHPTSDVFVALCDIYKINNISDVFNSKEPKGFPITAEERQLIENYRQHPEMQGAVRKILNIGE